MTLLGLVKIKVHQWVCKHFMVTRKTFMHNCSCDHPRSVQKSIRPAVTDVRVIKGAAVDSDHHIVFMNMNLRWIR